MEENKWYIVDVKKVKNEKKYTVTVGHSMDKPEEKPFVISETKLWTLAEKLFGRVHANLHKLVGETYPRTCDSPSFDLTQFVV